MAPAIDEARAVEETVRRFFAGGDDVDRVALTAGPLRDISALLREVELPARCTGVELRRVETTALRNGTAEVDLLAIERDEYPPRFALYLARKDAELVAAAAREAGVGLRLTEAARSWLAEAEDAGLGDRDYSAVLARILGTSVRS